MRPHLDTLIHVATDLIKYDPNYAADDDDQEDDDDDDDDDDDRMTDDEGEEEEEEEYVRNYGHVVWQLSFLIILILYCHVLCIEMYLYPVLCIVLYCTVYWNVLVLCIVLYLVLYLVCILWYCIFTCILYCIMYYIGYCIGYCIFTCIVSCIGYCHFLILSCPYPYSLLDYTVIMIIVMMMISRGKSAAPVPKCSLPYSPLALMSLICCLPTWHQSFSLACGTRRQYG